MVRISKKFKSWDAGETMRTKLVSDKLEEMIADETADIVRDGLTKAGYDVRVVTVNLDIASMVLMSIPAKSAPVVDPVGATDDLHNEPTT